MVRFASQAVFAIAEGDGYDRVYPAFNEGLPEGWVVDGVLEVDRVLDGAHEFVAFDGVVAD